MNKTSNMLLTLLLASTIGVSAAQAGQTKYSEVTVDIPVTSKESYFTQTWKQMPIDKKTCHIEHKNVQTGEYVNSTAYTAGGGVVGGLLGSLFGSGTGKVVAVGAGAVAGAIGGKVMADNHNNEVKNNIVDEEVCETNTVIENVQVPVEHVKYYGKDKDGTRYSIDIDKSQVDLGKKEPKSIKIKRRITVEDVDMSVGF